MTRFSGFALSAFGIALMTLASSPATARAQGTTWFADRYGIGANGTIGRGTYLLPGGPSDPSADADDRATDTRASDRTASNNSFTGRYFSFPSSSAWTTTSMPYLTNQYYEPGDGYRYPLYYNPATRSYFYYPVRR